MTKNRHYDSGIEVPACSRRDLILLAHQVHEVMDYSGDGPFSIMEFVEFALPRISPDFSLEILTEKELDKRLGLTYPQAGLIQLREDVYDAACRSEPVARFTVAHECGHLLKHANIPLSMARHEKARALPAYKSSEWQANAFAGALLMPSDKILEMAPHAISEKYQVSRTAAKVQSTAVMRENEKWILPKL